MTKTQTIEIHAYSSIGDRMAPTDHGTFATAGEAETFGKQKIKNLQWQVVEKTAKYRDNGNVDEEIKPLTKVFNRKGP